MRALEPGALYIQHYIRLNKKQSDYKIQHNWGFCANLFSLNPCAICATSSVLRVLCSHTYGRASILI